VAERPTVADRRLYLCTPDRPDLETFLDACIRGGVDIVQLRDKVLDARPLLERARVAQKVCADAGVPFVLNDRADLALELGADGVHVGQDDAPPSLARRLLGPGAIVGLSTHAPAELDASAAEDVDYVSTGPVEPPPRYAASTCARPFFVTGGVTPETVVPMLEAGARRFVVVRWLTESDEPERNARAVRAVIDRYW
jgi:thiamine-phosphate pyrophosphorylase